MIQVLGIFAKQPIAGQVKTRLADATSPAWAAQVAESFLHVTLDNFADLEGRRVLAYSPREAEAYFQTLSAGRFGLLPQGDGDLGQRMARFFAAHLVPSTNRVVLIGSDSPTLPIEFLRQAFDLLQNHEVVIGPATDGGYYLIGCTGQVPPIFAGTVWSGAEVLHDTIRALPASCRLALLPPWYDVDTLADYQMLHGHLLAQARAGVELNAGQRLLMNHGLNSPWLTD